MKQTTKFKELIHAPEVLMMPCCHDGLSAKVLEQAGFKAICAAGYGTSGSLLGKPDIGLLSGMESVRQYENLCSAVDIPVFVDIDTGYGDVNNVIRMVKECEKAGAAGLFIEDQTWPKRCGHFDGKDVVPVEEYLPKLKAALWARQDPDFVIMARTDAAGVHGIDEAIRRAKIYAETGCDMVFVEAVTTTEEMRRVNNALKEINVPSFGNMLEGGKTPLMTAEELQEVGYDIVVYPCSTLFVTVKALKEMAAHLKKNGTTEGYTHNMIDLDEYMAFMGAEELYEMEKKFL